MKKGHTMSMRGFQEGVNNTQPSDTNISITDNLSTHAECRAVYIGTAQDIDLYVQSDLAQTYAWVKFQGVVAGTVLPVMAKGARKTAASAAPTAGDIVFLY